MRAAWSFWILAQRWYRPATTRKRRPGASCTTICGRSRNWRTRCSAAASLRPMRFCRCACATAQFRHAWMPSCAACLGIASVLVTARRAMIRRRRLLPRCWEQERHSLALQAGQKMAARSRHRRRATARCSGPAYSPSRVALLLVTSCSRASRVDSPALCRRPCRRLAQIALGRDLHVRLRVWSTRAAMREAESPSAPVTGRSVPEARSQKYAPRTCGLRLPRHLRPRRVHPRLKPRRPQRPLPKTRQQPRMQRLGLRSLRARLRLAQPGCRALVAPQRRSHPAPHQAILCRRQAQNPALAVLRQGGQDPRQVRRPLFRRHPQPRRPQVQRQAM